MNTNEKDIPVPVAVLCLACVAGGWMYVSHLHSNPVLLQNLGQTVEAHMWVWTSGVIVLAANLGLVGSFLKRTIGLQKQGSRLKKLEGKKTARFRTTVPVFSFILSVKVLVLSGFLIRPALQPLIDLFGTRVYRWLLAGMSLNYALCAGFIAAGLLSWLCWRRRFQKGQVSPVYRYQGVS